jgi:hypothetical protein
MSFHAHAADARDPRRDIWLRKSAAAACVSHLCRLTGLPYRATLERVGLTWSILVDRPPPTPEFLERMVAIVERERTRYLAGLAAFEAARRQAKPEGRRQLSNAERRVLAGLRAAIDLRDAEAAG